MQIVLLLVLLFGFYFKNKNKKLDNKIQNINRKNYLDEEKKVQIKSIIRRLGWEKKKYESRYKKCFMAAIFLEVCVGVVAYVEISDGKNISLKKTSQDVLDEIFLSAGGVKENYDPAIIINSNNGRTEEEIVTEFFKDKLFFSWYEESSRIGCEKKRFYVEQIEYFMEKEENQISKMNDGIGRMEKPEEEIYDENIKQLDKIENSKVPIGYTREDVEMGRVMPLALNADTYLWEYELRWTCYGIRPSIPMLQQTAKAAEDATISLSNDIYRVVEMVEYAGYAVIHYLCLTRFDEAKESKADCCYWIAKLFCVLSEHLPKEWGDMMEHCVLMSYAFCEKGVDYVNTLKEKNDHENDLIQLREKMDLEIIQ